MISNYLLVTLRNIARHKWYSLINILSLSIGLVCFGILMIWVTGELQYDRFNENADRIYRVTNRLRLGSLDRSAPTTMAPAGPAMLEEIPGIKDMVRLGMSGTLWVKNGNNLFAEDSAYFADKTIFDVFSFKLTAGDYGKALEKPYSAVITSDLANKYFKDNNPIGKQLTINGNDMYTVTGILDDVPVNSHLRFNMLLSFETLYSQDRELLEMWNRMAFFTYVLLEKNASAAAVEKHFPELINKYMGELLKSRGATQELFLQPLTDIHLRSSLEGDPFSQGNILYVYVFTGIALIVLLIACFNFVNLMTARSVTRAREVVLRKVFGAARKQLVGQFIGEAVVLSFLAMCLGVILLFLVLPKFNVITGYNYRLSELLTPAFIIGGFILTIVTGLLAGIYPALFISSFRPARVLRGNAVVSSRSTLRRALVILQFSISVALIIATIVIQRQNNYMMNMDLGFNPKDVIVLNNINDPNLPSFDIVKQKISGLNGVNGVTASSSAPGWGGMLMSCVPEGFAESDAEMVMAAMVDANYIPLFQMNVVQGRNFSDKMLTDTSDAIIINETAVKRFGWKEPIGKTIRLTRRRPGGQEFIIKKVVGVIKDYHYESMHNPVGPLILERSDKNIQVLSIKLDPQKTQYALGEIKSALSDINPDMPFDYFTLEENIENSYGNEKLMAKIILYFSILAIFINVLGLIGMASFSTERRTKEIGIRKVLGATTSEIVRALCIETGVLILVSNIIAWPLAIMVLNRWLSTFAYRIHLTVIDIAIASLLTASVAIITVTSQAMHAAKSNPITALRQE